MRRIVEIVEVVIAVMCDFVDFGSRFVEKVVECAVGFFDWLG